MIYCKKVNLILPNIDMSKIVGGELREGYGKSFRSYHIVDLNYFNSIVSTRVKFNIPPDNINYTEVINISSSPHTDVAKGVALNYYLETARCITIFWEKKNPSIEAKMMPQLLDNGEWTESSAVEYEYSNLKRAAHFNANANEGWLLDIGKIHSIMKPDASSVRTFFRWIWEDREFDEILNSIEIL
jgi:hypothetical protein